MDRSRWSNGHGGNGKRTLQLFGEIIRQGVKPDVVFFVALLTACSDVGLSTASPPHCSLRLHGKEHANGAQRRHLGDSLGCLPNPQNVEIASHTAERISKLSTQRTGIHVLLSNIYASTGKWADVVKVRLQLKEKGVHKVADQAP
ncbi:hypothetical protein DVH24_001682 [Malus domestica]|uniref:Uncharacterized protein n=1 Tax=Malus domestica TaxID=3750 RepID=A0A498I7K6_MALDO|nr:hypothetical protein DVH24_001682 [Malus domestica]